MRLDTIYKNSNTQQASVSIGRGHVNGIYVNTKQNGWKVTARLRSEKGTEILVPNIDLALLAFVSDFYFGSSGSEFSTVVDIMNQLNESGAQGIVPESLAFLNQSRMNDKGYLTRIDLGSIYLNDGDELVFDFVNPTVATALHVSSFSEVRRAYELLTYEEVQDSNSSYHKAQAVFVNTKQIDLFGSSLTFKVSDTYGTNLLDPIAIFTATRLIGRFEHLGAPNHGMLWSNDSGLPESVNIQINGDGARDVSMLVVRKLFPQAAVSKNTLLEAKKKVEIISQIEKDEPETAKALRHAGLVEGKSEDMAAAVQEAEIAAKKD